MPTLVEYQYYAQLPQVRAALDTIAWAEGGKSYNTLFGGGTFSGNQHPNRAITAGGYTSTAAGRYQFLYSTWRGIQDDLGLADFGPANQDIGAVYLINQRGQLSKLLAGDFQGMMQGLGCLWAALPYATCGQTTRPLAQTLSYYNSALAVYGGVSNVPVPASTGIFAGISGSEIALLGGVALLAVLILTD
jgi:muramidase (phage lysozyme)